jgi:hypothetical protein
MHGSINVKSPNNINKWQMEFNSAFKELTGAFRDYASACTAHIFFEAYNFGAEFTTFVSCRMFECVTFISSIWS